MHIFYCDFSFQVLLHCMFLNHPLDVVALKRLAEAHATRVWHWKITWVKIKPQATTERTSVVRDDNHPNGESN